MTKPETTFGVVFDIDGVLPISSPRRLVRRLSNLHSRARWDRRSVLGMPGMLRGLSAIGGIDQVYYLTALPPRFERPLRSFLAYDGYPPGDLQMVGHSLLPRWRAADVRSGKQAAIDRLLKSSPQLRWVLLGDDGSGDPDLYADLATRSPTAVAAIALRQVSSPDTAGVPPRTQVLGVPVLRAPNGEELLPQLRAALALPQPDAGDRQNWLLGAEERGNDATRLRSWSEGNAVRALVHGSTYFAALADALTHTAADDLVLMVGWRGDGDERISTAGQTVTEALSGSARRGALVRGLLWRSHTRLLQFWEPENRQLADDVGAAGGQVLLDMRIRHRGSHHQKVVTIRHPHAPANDVAFVGGIDLAHARRDDAGHAGDPQTTPFNADYGSTPAWHDVHLQLRGPAVRDTEDVFRERWEDPAALSRLPWHVLPDWLHRLHRTAWPLPPAGADPPPAGRCTVQLLRTYPRRRPRYPFAPRGERSVALAYAKVLSRAERLVYVEDQYLWSVDVARLFAAALCRAPRLHLIVVVPRYPDQDSPVYPSPARFGHGQALAMVHHAGGDRVQILDVEVAGRPVYVHAKVCIIDDVWAAVGSANLNMRSWTHDSELTAAILDDERDLRAPADPAGLGDDARRFARDLRLQLLREHLECHDDTALLDPDRAASTIRSSAAALDAWYAGEQRGPRPPGRLRPHVLGDPQTSASGWHRWTTPAYRLLLDPDGRPLGMRLRRTY